MTKKENKTIEVRLRFWTNDLKETPANFAWDGGMVLVIADKEKGIPSAAVPFNGLNALPAAVIKATRKAGIRLVRSYSAKV